MSSNFLKMELPANYSLANHLTVCKQMTDVKLNFYCYIAILKTIYLCANKWLILNRIISVREKNHLPVCKQMSFGLFKKVIYKICI